MSSIWEPFAAEFMQRALSGGLIVGVLCAIAGTWVVLRGLAFLGEAMAHGMLPGVATAVLLGLPGPAGALVAAAAMGAGVGLASRRGRVSQDTAIGRLFVGMLALGVIIVSAARSFPVDISAILFGDILALGWDQIIAIAIAALVAIGLLLLFHRPLTALTFDPRVAHTLRMRPRLAGVALLAAIALAIVASYQAVGTLLVVGLLIAPPAAASLWARSAHSMMLIAAAIACLSVVVGLLVSWYGGWAAGASVALAATVSFPIAAVTRTAASRIRQ